MRWWRRLSLRGRLTLVGSFGLAAGLALGGLLILMVLHLVLTRSVDSTARQTASDVKLLVQANKISTPIQSVGTAFVQVVGSGRDGPGVIAIDRRPRDAGSLAVRRRARG